MPTGQIIIHKPFLSSDLRGKYGSNDHGSGVGAHVGSSVCRDERQGEERRRGRWFSVDHSALMLLTTCRGSSSEQKLWTPGSSRQVV
eukprot:765713-Hanusia_phi.AAC.2